MQEITTTASDGFGVPENRSNASPIIGKMVRFTNDGRFVVDRTTQLPTSPARWSSALALKVAVAGLASAGHRDVPPKMSADRRLL
jgi:hypothetical protein